VECSRDDARRFAPHDGIRSYIMPAKAVARHPSLLMQFSAAGAILPSTRHPQSSTLLNTSAALIPPNPNELLSAKSTLALRPVRGM
jgi:hypothetical protein